MKQALEALESDPVSHAGLVNRKQAITALRQALETEKQEPVGHEPGPTAWQCQCGKPYTLTCISSKPPKKEWVSLTDQEVWQAIDNVLEGGGWLDVARVLEQAFKEKNT
jgi:hypothetical protein